MLSEFHQAVTRRCGLLAIRVPYNICIERRVIVLISQSTPNGTSNATSSSKVVKRVALDGGISHDGHDARRAAFHPLPRHVFSLKRCVVRYVYVSIVVLDSVVIPMRGS